MRWLRLVGTIVAVIGAILASAKTIVDWLGRVDFIVSHQTEHGWIGGAMEYLVAPPWWLPWCVLASGLALIWADSRRSTSAGQPRPNLTFECNLAGLPSRCPAEGRIASMRLSYSPGAESAPPINLIIRHCLPGDALDWFSDIKFPQVYRCEITNYGDAPLLQVMLKFNIEYREALPNDPNATTSKAGETVYSHEWPILFAKIDPGKDNAATFYVYNESTFFAFVSPPRTASYVPLGQTAAREAAVSLIGMTAGMSLFPVERTPAR